MFEFAQTNLQLYRQMELLGYNPEEREKVAAGYRFLMPTFSGLYRGTEKPFITHLVGTASILVAYRASIDWVLAGLLHAVYAIGDFGFDPGTRETPRKRRLVSNLIGEEAEDLIIAYDAMRWTESAVDDYLRGYQQHSQQIKAALNLQLANTLEDLLDLGTNYERGTKFATMSSPKMQQAILALARMHSWPGLARQLEQALAAFNAGVTPVDAGGAMGQSKLVLPPSAQRKFISTARGSVVRRMRRAKGRIKK
jgi:hypothetical protein